MVQALCALVGRRVADCNGAASARQAFAGALQVLLPLANALGLVYLRTSQAPISGGISIKLICCSAVGACTQRFWLVKVAS